jgi:hypothetical protein
VVYFFSAIVLGLALVSLFGCGSEMVKPPREITCLIRAPKPVKAPGADEFPATEPPGLAVIESGALECWNPIVGKGVTIPFEEADKFVCRPPSGQREYDLYLKLRGL